MIYKENFMPAGERLRDAKETVWINPECVFAEREKILEAAYEQCGMTEEDTWKAEERLQRFAPLIRKLFPETEETGGIIESALEEIPDMKSCLEKTYSLEIPGRVFLKKDSHLPVAGSVKARGGIYEVLKHTEDIARERALLTVSKPSTASGASGNIISQTSSGNSFGDLAEPEAAAVFREYAVQVGSTGNLGMSIGIMSAALGYRAAVHMSADARQWKKDLLRDRGVTVVEYEGDYGQAVEQGRRLSEEDPKSYFVDDENSKDLFLGYSTAGPRLKRQLEEKGLFPDREHPLFVYLPCGVGGAPGGITFGLKQAFGDAVHCFFAEPVQAPCVLLGMASGLGGDICVQDIGLTGKTHADGLAVGRASSLVCRTMRPLLSGAVTVEDRHLYDHMRELLDSEKIFLEPSACAAFYGLVSLWQSSGMKDYLKEHGLTERIKDAVHIVWATGGSLVPEEIRKEYMETFLKE